MIDSYYRMKALNRLGIRIHLHCFQYGRLPSDELESLCETVNYYPRKSGFLHLFSSLPYIIATRQAKELLENLIKNDYPILFDGLHTTYLLNHPALTKRKKLMRAHNIEHYYYKTLSNYETFFLKKLYFRFESYKLKKYEKVLAIADSIFSISNNEQAYFENKYHNSVYVAPFHPFNEPECLPGFGKYILYHGDLSVNENIAVVNSLISEVFSKVSFPCIVAGKNPSKKLFAQVDLYPNIRIISNPDKSEMKNLIQNAHIHLIPAFATNGFKLKLLYALYSGRHCIINSSLEMANSLKNICHTANSNEEIIEKIQQLLHMEFTNGMISERKKPLTFNYSNILNAHKLIDNIFKE
jgi:glycosyl transferase family 1